jgi:hypothetical protein
VDFCSSVALRRVKAGVRWDEALPGILADGSFKLSGAVLVLLAELRQELELAEKIDRADSSMEKIAWENEAKLVRTMSRMSP